LCLVLEFSSRRDLFSTLRYIGQVIDLFLEVRIDCLEQRGLCISELACCYINNEELGVIWFFYFGTPLQITESISISINFPRLDTGYITCDLCSCNSLVWSISGVNCPLPLRMVAFTRMDRVKLRWKNQNSLRLNPRLCVPPHYLKDAQPLMSKQEGDTCS
jgi:hypothetical protein